METEMNDRTRLLIKFVRVWMLAGCLLVVTVIAGESRSSQPRGTISREEYMTRMNQVLDEMIAKTEASPKKTLIFSFNLFYAHGAMIKGMPLETLIKTVDTMVEAGVRRVDINMGLFPWSVREESTIAKYDALVKHIRNHGLELAINPQYTPSTDGKMHFSEWQRKAVDMFAQVARRYHPEIFTVIHEPTTIAARFGERIRPHSWANFAQKAIRAVKRVSPNTKTSVGVLSWEKPYFNAFLRLNDLDAVGIDIYNLRGMAVYDRMIKAAHAKGLPVHIEETWRNPYFDPRRDKTLEAKSARGIGEARYQELDVKWLTAMTRYANTRGLEAVTPFWMQAFFLYVDDEKGGGLEPGYNRRTAAAIMSGQRTETLNAYQALIKRYGR